MRRALRNSTVVALLLFSGCTCREAPRASPLPRLRKVDVHVHAEPAAVPRLVQLMDARGLDVAVNLSGGWPGAGLEDALAAAKATNGRVIVFANPPLQLLRAPHVDVPALAEQLQTAHAMGARGVKFFKSLGLGARWADGTLMAVD
ncbi:MAG: hypothetical protein Q8L14_17815, partial [Myxococcales bacterium]|nr:hypothetical protein [Myxococcales bacterium]